MNKENVQKASDSGQLFVTITKNVDGLIYRVDKSGVLIGRGFCREKFVYPAIAKEFRARTIKVDCVAQSFDYFGVATKGVERLEILPDISNAEDHNKSAAQRLAAFQEDQRERVKRAKTGICKRHGITFDGELSWQLALLVDKKKKIIKRMQRQLESGERISGADEYNKLCGQIDFAIFCREDNDLDLQLSINTRLLLDKGDCEIGIENLRFLRHVAGCGGGGYFTEFEEAAAVSLFDHGYINFN